MQIYLKRTGAFFFGALILEAIVGALEATTPSRALSRTLFLKSQELRPNAMGFPCCTRPEAVGALQKPR